MLPSPSTVVTRTPCSETNLESHREDFFIEVSMMTEYLTLLCDASVCRAMQDLFFHRIPSEKDS